MIFEDIPGLKEKKEQLIGAVRRNHVAHAQLFAGEPGSPGLAMALAYAGYLNCDNPGEHDACGQCASCSKNRKFVHPDVHFVFPVSNTKAVKAEDAVSEKFLPQWRQFLTSNPFGTIEDWIGTYGGEDRQVNISKRESREIVKALTLKAFEGKYKIMIIWLPEFMHPSAANALLKILEEPSENTVFLLVAFDTERLLTTITSRTQRVFIPKPNHNELVSLLCRYYKLSESEAARVAPLADGDPATALKLAADKKDDSHTFFAEWMRNCFKRDFKKLVEMADKFHAGTKLLQRSTLKYGLAVLREALIHEHAPQLHKIDGKPLQFAEKFGEVLSGEKIDAISELINEAHFHLERNGSPKIVFLDLSLQIASQIK